MRMRTLAAIALVILLSLRPAYGAEGSSDSIRHEETNRQAFALPFADLSMQQMRAFALGNRTFNLRWAVAPASARDVDGLGPSFAQHACSACHVRDGRSRLPEDGAITQAVIKLVAKDDNDRPWLQARYGGELQSQAIAGVRSEGTPQVRWVEARRVDLDGHSIVLRRPQIEIVTPGYGDLAAHANAIALTAPAVFGLGLVENIDTQAILAGEDAEDRDGDGISGRAPRLLRDGREVVGRFGWKASAASLKEQIAMAASADMGLTSAAHAEENCPPRQRACREAVRGDTPDLSEPALVAIETYLRVLAVPAARTARSEAARQGAEAFRALGCAACHRETFRTGDQSSIALLNGQTIQPYSDFLLHDMGEELADGREVETASGREWRTPPLWGVGLQRNVTGHLRLLHDGRADGLIEAILWHGGEATQARERFQAATSKQRAELLAFLESL